jgi:hypothetical protein
MQEREGRMEPESDDWSEADDGIEFFDLQTGAPVSDDFARVLAIDHDDHVHVAPDPWHDNRIQASRKISFR